VDRTAGWTPRDALDLFDLARIAKQQLATPVWDFVAGGAGRETTLRANRTALDAVGVIPRVLRDISGHDASTNLFGRLAAVPVVVAPIAYQRLVHPDGELATAAAARARGVPLCISTLSSYSIERIADVGARTWFQLYWLREARTRDDLIARAEAAGCDALVVTLDVPWMGRRHRDIRNQFTLPPDVIAANLSPAVQAGAAQGTAGSAVATHTADLLSPALTWVDIEALVARTDLPVVLKGILCAADARRARECGVSGVVVSNHGGRQLDGVVASIDSLPAVRAAVGADFTVLFDSGVRSGADILKAVALGADAVLIGRPVIWGLAAGGTPGVDRALELFTEEFLDALGLSGCASVADARELETRGVDAAGGGSLRNDRSGRDGE
jgi:4-hydroxymandelate oxidase